MGWDPSGYPSEAELEEQPEMAGFHLAQRNKIRLSYCETETERAGDWHRHAPVEDGTDTLWAPPPRAHPDRPWEYDRKPMVAVSCEEAEELAERLSDDDRRFALPSEAQWERAARGGLIGAPYPWGHEPPTHDRCDFDHIGEPHIADPKTFPPNGYGLFAMSGSVSEWTSTPYDALAYRGEPPSDEATERVLRGGSWTDSAYAIRVAFRMSRAGGSWRTAQWSAAGTPTIGFRLCLTEPADD